MIAGLKAASSSGVKYWLKVLHEGGVLAHEGGVVPGHVEVDGAGGVVLLEVAVDLEAVAQEDDLHGGAGLGLELLDRVVHGLVGLAADVGHADGDAAQVLVQAGVLRFGGWLGNGNRWFLQRLLRRAGAVVAGVFHQLAGLLDGVVQAVLDADVAQDDALQAAGTRGW